MSHHRSRSARGFDTHVRMSEAEHQRATELSAACRCSISEVLRAGLAKQPHLKPAKPLIPVFDLNAVREIRRIGVTLNQLLRELYRHDRQAVSLTEIHNIDTQLMRVIVLVYLGRDAAQQLMAERFATWFAGVRLPPDREPNRPA